MSAAPKLAKARSKVRKGGTLMRQPGAEEKWAAFVRENAARYTPEKCAKMLDAEPHGLGRLLGFVGYGNRPTFSEDSDG